MTKVVKHWCLNKVETVKQEFTWEISNFKFFRGAPGRVGTSSRFGNNKWCLLLYPNGYDKHSKGYLSVYLKCLTVLPRKVIQVQFKTSLLSRAGTYDYAQQIKSLKCRKGLVLGFQRFIKRDAQFNLNYLVYDKLTIFCEVIVAKEFRMCDGPEVKKRRLSGLSEDFEKLFDSNENGDVTIKVGDEILRAHKAILSASSPVFSAMFKYQTRENQENSISITDFNKDVLVELLRFMYTGKTRNLLGMAEDLLPAAEKYAILRLKQVCEHILADTLSIENAVRILILADIHNCMELKSCAQLFICGNAEVIKRTEEWKKLLSWKPSLVIDVDQKYIRSMQLD